MGVGVVYAVVCFTLIPGLPAPFGERKSLLEAHAKVAELRCRRFSRSPQFATLPLPAQWLNHIPAGTPMKDGKPNLSAPAPRATNGKPDLTGVWMHETFSLEQMREILWARRR